MSILRNRLTVVESKNTLLEQEKDDLEGTITKIRDNVKPETGNTSSHDSIKEEHCWKTLLH